MKKRVLWCAGLILLPLLAVGLAAMPDSVRTVVSKTEVVKLSFFDKLPDGSYPSGLALGGLFCCVTAVLGIVYAILRKPYWLYGIAGSALFSACLCVLPLLLRVQPPVVPNVGVSIAMCAECVLALWYQKALKKAPAEDKGPRLKLR